MSNIVNRSDRSAVSIEPGGPADHPPEPSGRTTAATAPGRGIALAVALALVLATTLFSVGAAGAQDDPPEPDRGRITSVQFELEPVSTADDDPLSATGSEFEARYRTVIVTEAGTDVRLEPLSGPVTVSLTEHDALAMTAELNGLRIGHATPDFGDALADAVSSSSAHRFARLGADEAGQPVSVDVFYSRPLTASDHLLIQEGGGDGTVDLAALDAAGNPVGAAIRLGPTRPESAYQWNTGHGPHDGYPAWASVVGISGFQTDQPVGGIRITATGAEVKALALTASAKLPTLPVDPTDGVASDAGSAVADSTVAEPEPPIDSAATVPPPVQDQPLSDGAAIPVVSATESADDQQSGQLVEVAAPPVVAAATSSEVASTAPADTGSVSTHSHPTQTASPVAGAEAITQLALTGMVTEPWVMVIFAMGFIFIGYTVYAAFQRQAGEREPCGHDQLDTLGFD